MVTNGWMVWMGRSMAVVAAASLCGCAAQDDDDAGTQSVGETSSSSSDASSSGAETSTGGELQSCVDARLEAAQFLAANRACEVDTDCTSVSTFCIEQSTCGSSAIAVGYDMAMWMEISAGLDTCTDCGADPCGACSVCNDGTCTLDLQCE